MEEGVDCGGHRAVQLVANEFILTPPLGLLFINQHLAARCPFVCARKITKEG